MKVLGIIPAKRVSSRIKNKNIKKINNRYLIEYTILSSIKSKVFSNIIVSSDSLKGTFVAVPERSQIPENIKEQLIVELYSK